MGRVVGWGYNHLLALLEDVLARLEAQLDEALEHLRRRVRGSVGGVHHPPSAGSKGEIH